LRTPEAKIEPEPETKRETKPDTKPTTEPETKPETKTPPSAKVEPGNPYSGKTRPFLFTYAARIKELPAGALARIWIPIATSNAQQEVTIIEQFLGEAKINRDKQYGNSIAYFEAKANEKGEIPFEVTYRVKRKEVRTDPRNNVYVTLLPGEPIARYLQPDAKVPISGKPLELLKANLKEGTLPQDPVLAAKEIYDFVSRHMTYKKVGAGLGQGDALWACDSKFGNSIDLHSLFISIARGNRIASKLEMGFSIPVERGVGTVDAYHSWAWFLLNDKGWIPVDLAEANQHSKLASYYFGNLNESRISFTVGRDITLDPGQDGPPLNFFIDPYVEVNGKPYPLETIQRKYSYKDVL
jgi:transglutaminase-like putative cysteine protease